MGWDSRGHTHNEDEIDDLDHNDPDAIHDNVSGEIAAVTEKAAPVDGDWVLIEDSEAADAKKRAQLGNLPGGGGSGGTSSGPAIVGGDSATTNPDTVHAGDSTTSNSDVYVAGLA